MTTTSTAAVAVTVPYLSNVESVKTLLGVVANKWAKSSGVEVEVPE